MKSLYLIFALSIANAIGQDIHDPHNWIDTPSKQPKDAATISEQKSYVEDASEVRVLDTNYFTAYVLPVGHEDRIAIRRRDPRDLAELSLLSKDNQQGGHVEQISWSPDRKFLVFSTSSSGGHSPWNFRTYIFSTERWEFLNLDDVVSPITSADFSFSDSRHLSVEALKTPSSATDESEERIIDLETLPWKSPKTEQDAAANP